MVFRIIGRTGPEMRQVVEFGDRFTGRGTFGGEFGARHCIQLRRTCATVPQPSELRFGVVRAVGRGIAVLDWGPRRPRGRGGFGGLFSIFTMGNAIWSLAVKCFRFLCKNFTTFPFGKLIVGKLHLWPFWQYIQF